MKLKTIDPIGNKEWFDNEVNNFLAQDDIKIESISFHSTHASQIVNVYIAHIFYKEI